MAGVRRLIAERTVYRAVTCYFVGGSLGVSKQLFACMLETRPAAACDGRIWVRASRSERAPFGLDEFR